MPVNESFWKNHHRSQIVVMLIYWNTAVPVLHSRKLIALFCRNRVVLDDAGNQYARGHRIVPTLRISGRLPATVTFAMEKSWRLQGPSTTNGLYIDSGKSFSSSLGDKKKFQTIWTFPCHRGIRIWTSCCCFLASLKISMRSKPVFGWAKIVAKAVVLPTVSYF